jgi:hypothetical protein
MTFFPPFFTFFQLRSFSYAPSKSQKLTKNKPVFAIGRKSWTRSYLSRQTPAPQ